MRSSPYTPLRVKAKGKENSRYALKPRLSRARGRVTRLTREVDAALDEAIMAFNGTAEDRRIWARIAWRIGAENFHHLVIEKISENSNDGLPDSLAATFQAFIDKRYPKPSVDAIVSIASKRNDCPCPDAFGTNASTVEAANENTSHQAR